MRYKPLVVAAFVAAAVAVPAAAKVVPLDPRSYVYDAAGRLDVGSLALSVAYVVTTKGDRAEQATGFFFEHGGGVYLITNRHVVLREDADDYWKPDTLQLTLHVDAGDIATVEVLNLPLYDRDGRPVWLEHPTYKGELDVVAIPCAELAASPKYTISPFAADNFVRRDYDVVYVGEDVVILGYPLGYYDYYHNVPLLRQGIIASFYPLAFNRRPVFYVDARLHSGMSGSPVLFPPGRVRDTVRTSADAATAGKIYLLGVNATRVDRMPRPTEYEVVLKDVAPGGFVASAEPIKEKDEPLGLNEVYYADYVVEIIEGRK